MVNDFANFWTGSFGSESESTSFNPEVTDLSSIILFAFIFNLVREKELNTRKVEPHTCMVALLNTRVLLETEISISSGSIHKRAHLDLPELLLSNESSA